MKLQAFVLTNGIKRAEVKGSVRGEQTRPRFQSDLGKFGCLLVRTRVENEDLDASAESS